MNRRSLGVAVTMLVLAALSIPFFSSCGNKVNLLSVVVSPSSTTLGVGATQQYGAIGNYSDDSSDDITSSVTWSSSNVLVSLVSNTTGSQGLATAVAAGTASIIAIDPGTNLQGTASLTVN